MRSSCFHFFFFVQFPVYNLWIVCFFFCLYLLVVVVTIFRKLGFDSAGGFFFSQNIDIRSTDVRSPSKRVCLDLVLRFDSYYSVFISDSCVCIKKETLLDMLENEAVWIRWTLYVCLFCISLRKSKFLYDEFLFWGLRWVAWFDCKQGTCLQMMWLVPWRNTDGTWWIQWWPEPKLFTKTSAPLWASLLLFPMLLYSSKKWFNFAGLVADECGEESRDGRCQGRDMWGSGETWSWHLGHGKPWLRLL